MKTIALRDALPFFKNRQGKVAQSYWNVTPSGDYSADLETGKAYARAFMPYCGSTLVRPIWLPSCPTWRKPGAIPRNNPKDWRGIDAVALGFMMEIGGSLQASIVGMAVARGRDRKARFGPWPQVCRTGQEWHGTARP